MVTVDDVYKLMQFIINKSQNGNLTPSQFNLVINEGQNEYLSFLMGNILQYQHGRPVPKVQLGNNEIVRQKLVDIIYHTDLTIDSGGKCPYPNYLIQVDAMYTQYNLQRIRWVAQDRLWETISSVIDKVQDYPIYLLENDGFHFYPENLGAAKMSYVKQPPVIKWGYTTDTNGRPVYDPNTSTDPFWNEIDIMQVIVRALRMVGVNLNDVQVSQYSQEIKIQG